MTVDLIYSITFIILYIAFSVISLFFLIKNFNKETKLNYSFSRYFSFEVHNLKNNSTLISYRLLYIFTLIMPLSSVIYLLINLNYNHTLDVYLVVACVILLVTIISKILLFITKTLNINLFLKEFVFNYLAVVSEYMIFLIGLFIQLNENRVINFELNLSYIIIFIVIVVTLIGLLFNKNLYSWYKLERKEDGTYVRPKVLYLALYEWISYFLNIIFVIMLTTYILFI